MIKVLLFACFALCLCGSASSQVAANRPITTNVDNNLVVATQHGLVRGTEKHEIRTFLGIPYARPPLGRLRWRPPQPAIDWSGIELANSYGGRCAQGSNGTFSDATSNEDCLYLNVFTPTKVTSTTDLPVMVWIHGGGLSHGSSNVYDAQELVRQGHVVVVTINYRMNIFGFLALSGLDEEGHVFGNYGLMDQQFAFKWVKRNISSFGGDPNKVVIFGESSGGLSVLANIISPSAKGLFNAAIEQSGSYTGLETPVSLITAEKRGEAFAEKMGCNKSERRQTISCLRALSVEEIQTVGKLYANGRPSFIVDGTTIKKTQGEAFRTGEFNRVPIILGTNRDEVRNFVGDAEYRGGTAITDYDLDQTIRKSYGARADRILTAYSSSRYKHPDLALAAVETDHIFVCPALNKAGLLMEYVPTYYYEFADRTAPVYLDWAPISYGAYHSAELQYIFVGFHGARGRMHRLDKTQEELSSSMLRYWSTFAKDRGNPNSMDNPNWPVYGRGSYMSFEGAIPKVLSLSLLKEDHHCKLWDSLGD